MVITYLIVKVLVCQSNEATAATIAKISLSRRGGDHINQKTISRDPTAVSRHRRDHMNLNVISTERTPVTLHGFINFICFINSRNYASASFYAC